jgi:hypothetical protein
MPSSCRRLFKPAVASLKQTPAETSTKIETLSHEQRSPNPKNGDSDRDRRDLPSRISEPRTKEGSAQKDPKITRIQIGKRIDLTRRSPFTVWLTAPPGIGKSAGQQAKW